METTGGPVRIGVVTDIQHANKDGEEVCAFSESFVFHSRLRSTCHSHNVAFNFGICFVSFHSPSIRKLLPKQRLLSST